MDNIKTVSYNNLIQYLRGSELNSKKDIYFLLTDKITLCINNEDNLVKEIERNNDFFILENSNKIIYIDGNIINDLKVAMEVYINEYIKEKDSHFNKIKNFSMDDGVKDFVSLNGNIIDVKPMYQLKDIINMLNRLYYHTSSSKLLNRLIKEKSEVLKLVLSTNRIRMRMISKSSDFFSIRKVEDIIRSVSNKIDVFPNGIFPLNKSILLLNLKGCIEFNEEFKNKKPEKLSEINKKINFNQVVDSNDDVLLKKIDNINENKNKIKELIFLYNGIYEIINKIKGVIYYYSLFDFVDNYCEDIVGIEKDKDFLIRTFFKKRECANENQEIEKFHIPDWDLAQNIYNNLIDLLNKYKIGNDNTERVEYNELCDFNESLEKNIVSIKKNLNQAMAQKNRLFDFYEKFNLYINGMQVNDNINLLVKDRKEIKKSLDTLADIIYSKIKYRKEGFLSSVYKLFFPKKHSEIIKRLTENKKLIDSVIEYLYLSEKYLLNTCSFGFGMKVEQHVRVVNDDFFIKNAINMVSKLSLSTDIFDSINNKGVQAKNILDSIFLLK